MTYYNSEIKRKKINIAEKKKNYETESGQQERSMHTESGLWIRILHAAQYETEVHFSMSITNCTHMCTPTGPPLKHVALFNSLDFH